MNDFISLNLSDKKTFSYQEVLMEFSLWSVHGLDHELVLVLLRGIIVEWLETYCDADLGVGINYSRVWLHTIPRE